MEIASYGTADGSVNHIAWDEGRFFVQGHEISLAQVLEWDSAGMLAWVSPETQVWARSLNAPVVASSGPDTAATVPVQAEPQVASGEPAAGTRLALLADVLATMAQYPGYTAQYGTDTDIRIDNLVAQASWGTGKKKVDFSAHMKAVEPERTLYYFEVLKEMGSGLSFGGMKSESYTTFGTKRSGTTKEVVIGPGGVAMDYTWDYGATRQILESVCARHGWRMKVVLLPGAAKY